MNGWKKIMMNDADSAEIISLLIAAEQDRQRVDIWKAFEELGMALDALASEKEKNDE